MSYTRLLYHIIFRPKAGVPAIPIEHEKVLYGYIWSFIKKRNGVLYRIGGMPDHVHMLVQLPPSIAVADFMRDLKTATNLLLHKHKEEFPRFQGWGKSYCALSYDTRDKDMIVSYIKRQKEHHQHVSFHDELLEWLQAEGVEVDMTYFLKD